MDPEIGFGYQLEKIGEAVTVQSFDFFGLKETQFYPERAVEAGFTGAVWFANDGDSIVVHVDGINWIPEDFIKMHGNPTSDHTYSMGECVVHAWVPEGSAFDIKMDLSTW